MLGFLGTDVEDQCRGSWCAQRGTWRASNGAGTRVFGRGVVPRARPVRVVRGDVREEQAWPLRRFGAMRWRNDEAEAEQRREKVKKKGAQCPLVGGLHLPVARGGEQVCAGASRPSGG